MIKGVFLPGQFSRYSSWLASIALVHWQEIIGSIVPIYSSIFPTRLPVVSEICVAHTEVGHYGAAKFLLHNHNHTVSCRKPQLDQSCLQFSTAIQSRICWEASSHEILLQKLESSLKEHNMGEAWEAFNDFKSLHGFPPQIFVSKLVIELAYSDTFWLQKAYELVLVILKEKANLLHCDSLAILSLMLARAQMPILASRVLRLMLEKDGFLSSVWNSVFLHMVKTQIGTYLASEILIEICDSLLSDHCRKRRELFKCTNTGTTIFNLVLKACARFGSTIKAEQIIGLMPQMGVRANAGTIVIMALIYEKNGQREELQKLKEHVDEVSIHFGHHYRQFYDSLLSLHFKFNEIGTAAELILDLYRCQKTLHDSNQFQAKDRHFRRPCLVPIGSQNLRTGLRLRIEPGLLESDFILETKRRAELIGFMDGRLFMSNKALAMLVVGYLKDGKVGELGKFLVSVQKLGLSEDGNFSSVVIDACIHMGWFEAAHDILDDMESASVPVDSAIYFSLLKAYREGNLLKEVRALAKHMKKSGLLIESSDDLDTKNINSARSGLTEALIRVIRDGSTPAHAYEINSSIYFFCKAKMMEDALKTFRRMQEMNLAPTNQTFSYLVNGCSSLQMYREITILWGEIRRGMDQGILSVDRDLYEILLWNFIRGGYFERALDIICCMTKHGMFIDKWKYKREFMKFHKDLYRRLKTSEAKTEAQSNRLEHVRAFRKWVGID